MATTLIPDHIRNVNANPMLRFLISRRWRVARHLLLISGFLLMDNGNGQYGPDQFVLNLLAILFFLIFIYFNMYLLVPKLLFRGRYVAYVLSFAGTLVFVFLTVWCLDNLVLIKPATEKKTSLSYHDFAGVIYVFGVILAASTAIKLFQQYVIDSHRINELEKDRLQSELNQLKSQINPHFLFNTLNNVQVLTQRDPNKASMVLLKLSDLLRFQLYDSAQDNILLSSDIAFLDNFLNLEKIRRDHFWFTIQLDGSAAGKFIPPFLFIPFVENAIKHNVDSMHESYVMIHFRIEGHILVFTCENSKPTAPSQVRKRTGGLGLLNIQRRLQLCYPDRHSLEIRETDNRYFVTLTIPV